MKKIFLLFTLLIIGCSSSKETTTKQETTATLKEHVVTYKDTTFTVPTSTASLRISKRHFVTVPQSSKKDSIKIQFPKHFTKTTGRATANATITKDTVFVDCECDSIAMRAKLKQELIKEITTQEINNNHKQVKKKGVSIFSLVLYCIAFLVVGAVAGYLIRLFNII